MIKTILLSCVAVGALSGAALADDTPNWEGFYLGVHGGYGLGTFSDPAGGIAFPDTEVRGGFGGGQWGYNFALIDGVVTGLEADVNWAGQTGEVLNVPTKSDPPYTSNFADKINWTGAITGKIGVELGPLLPYVLGGVAFANHSVSNTGNNTLNDPVAFDASTTNTQTGWVGGVGLAASVAPALSAFAEYRYADYGAGNYSTGATANQSIRLVNQTVRIGVNFQP